MEAKWLRQIVQEIQLAAHKEALGKVLSTLLCSSPTKRSIDESSQWMNESRESMRERCFHTIQKWRTRTARSMRVVATPSFDRRVSPRSGARLRREREHTVRREQHDWPSFALVACAFGAAGSSALCCVFDRWAIERSLSVCHQSCWERTAPLMHAGLSLAQ